MNILPSLITKLAITLVHDSDDEESSVSCFAKTFFIARIVNVTQSYKIMIALQYIHN